VGREKRQFSREFKSEAVHLSYQRDNIKYLANELGVQAARIYKWRAGDKNETKAPPTIKKQDNQEVKELRKALNKAELELEILKKAVHIFSKSDGKFTNLQLLIRTITPSRGCVRFYKYQEVFTTGGIQEIFQNVILKIFD